MRDFPVFTTEFGVASLVLREIPYRSVAYITIQDSLEPEKLLGECVGFCRACGADIILAKGHACLERYPLYTSVLEMRGTAWVDAQKLESLFPVTEATVERWRQIYNEGMKGVDCAETLTARDSERILNSGGAYFIHKEGTLLGIGWMEDTKLLAVCGVQPGAGERIMHTLMSLVEGVQMHLEVASTNTKAIRLYEKLGFVKTRELLRWYRMI